MGCLHSKHCFRDTTVQEPENLRADAAEDDRSLTDADTTGVSVDQDDRIHRMAPGRDTDGGINRLNRVSAQFLPPEGSRIVKVPQGNYELRYSYLSQRGYYPEALDKANQDSYCIHSPFGLSPDDHFFGVFDGHGEFGAQCSQFVKRKLCENLLRNGQFHVDAVEALHCSYLLTNSQLHLDDLDDSMSGTTAVTALVRGTTLYVANTGDSRAVIAERRGKELVAVDLSVDQTPFRLDELERIKLCGARVLTLDQIEGLKDPDIQYWGTEGDDGDPPRVWVQNGMYPGTAFTRSLGDMIAESIGVVANPEVVVLNLTAKNPFLVVASDGVFEFLSSQTVVDIVSKFKDPRDACAAVVAEAYRLWLQFETRTDDITVIVVHINGLPNELEHIQAGAAIQTLPVLQIADTAGAESPAKVPWYTKNQRVRQELSRARLRAIESSLENGVAWVPPSPKHRKTWEEEAHIERALRDHFLFRRLTEPQSQVMLDCMQRVEVKAGDIVVRQGGEGDCFYVVGSGEFEVSATQVEDNGKEITKVLHRYTAEKLSSFGELALMYNKPLQASVCAVTDGTLWALKREDFRGILMSEFSDMSFLRLLRSIDLFSKLTILQLSRVSDCLSEVTFLNGEEIINKNDTISSLYIIRKGQVKLTYNTESFGILNVPGISSDDVEQPHNSYKREEVELSEGSHFGEWALLGNQITSLCAVALSNVTCAIITKEKFDSVVGPLPKFQQGDRKFKDSLLPSTRVQRTVKDDDTSRLSKMELSDVEWKMILQSTDCSETGIVLPKESGKYLTMKRYSKRKVKQLGKEALVLKEREFFKILNASPCVPYVLCTCSDKLHAAILLNTWLVCPLTSVLTSPLDELSAQFCAASVVIALEELHKNAILYRGVSPENLMFDRSGHLQIIDFQFAKRLSEDRTFTICGIADFLAPEIIQGKGHGFAADWWALGVLLYFMLQLESPFGSRRESEVETVGRIAKGLFILPHTFSTEVVDLITKLLDVNENARLGSAGADHVKNHIWFKDVDWQGIIDHTINVPEQIATRLDLHVRNCVEKFEALSSFPLEDPSEIDLDCFDDW